MRDNGEMRNLVLLIVLGSGLVAACGGGGSSPTGANSGGTSSNSSGGAAIPVGTWGGEHVSLQVLDSGATFQFDCAHGSIPAPLSVGSDGAFRLTGVFVKEHGGPIRVGEPEDSQAANYFGKIQGKTMSLSIELVRDQQTVGPYTLEFDNPGHIVRCL